MRIPRRAARVAILDPAGSVFMFRYDNEEVGVHWALPGGGLDPGESPERAAAREETGWTDIGLPTTPVDLGYVRNGPPGGGDRRRSSV
ncbi:NUDIX domain-containing protein [Streptomyces huiliensis]|uniref:NUDIX domain-containing protein n=1 Tax=Streptomyces huiliensis TaxID=2876027 RepID=UPI0027DFB8EF|nr:NUDIX domain-containing protein [Streptomyces huiliensis]MBZ4324157.1 NUDIX domain-containing protein [Streptomyces huiliensis]